MGSQGKVISWEHNRSDAVRLAVSFIWDGTFFRAWDLLGQVFPTLPPILEIPTAANIGSLLETISPRGNLTAEACNTIDLYKRMYSASAYPNRHNKHVEALFEVFRAAHASGDADTCRQVARFFKRLISVGQIPDITLNLISDGHYQDFFVCLGYLEENADISSGFRRYFSEQSKFNNFLGISNPEILENINNNFRIIFLKDFIFPTFLTDRQIEELNTFLFLHNNTIACHINSIVAEKMRDIDAMIERDPVVAHDFFGELFYIFKVTIHGLKVTFIQRFVEAGLHLKVVALMARMTARLLENSAGALKILKTISGYGHGSPRAHGMHVAGREVGRSPDRNLSHRLGDPAELLEVSVDSGPFSSSLEMPIHHQLRILSVCLEIISFLVRNSQKAFLALLEAPPESPSFLQLMPDLLSLPGEEFYREFLELFISQNLSKPDDADPQFPAIVARVVVPFFAGLAQKKATESAEEQRSSRKATLFVVELFNSLYQYQSPELSEALTRHSVLPAVSDLLLKTKKKGCLLPLLRYVKESIVKDDPGVSRHDWKKAFRGLWEAYVRHGRKRANQLNAMSLLIFKHVKSSKNFRLLKQFAKAGRKYPPDAHEEPILQEIFSKFDDMRVKLQGPELELTSESEASLTTEKVRQRVSESFLEREGDGAKGEPVGFSTPKGLQELFRKLGRRDPEESQPVVRVLKKAGEESPKPPPTISFNFDDGLLGKRPDLDPQ